MQKKLQGVTDAPLTVHGMTGQAQALAMSLAARPVLADGRPPIRAMVVSPLQRTRDTAAQIQEAHEMLGPPLEITYDAALKEKDFGSHEDTVYGSVQAPQEGGEDRAAFYKRVKEAFQPILIACAEASHQPATAEFVVVTHGLVISAFNKLFCPEVVASVSNTGRFVYHVSPDAKKVTCRIANDTTHLLSVRKQRGIGSLTYDPRQTLINAFFR